MTTVIPPGAPVKGAGLLLRLHSSKTTSLLDTSLDIPGADITSIISLTSTDEKVASGSPNSNIVYEVKHISKLVAPGAYDKDPAHKESTTSVLNWQVYKLINKTAPSAEETPKGSTMVCIGITPGEGALEDYAKWYDEEHIKLLSLVPGWRSSARYELAASFGGPEIVAPYIAVHFYDQINGLGGPEWKRSVETEWTKRVREKCAAPHFRRVWEVQEHVLNAA